MNNGSETLVTAAAEVTAIAAYNSSNNSSNNSSSTSDSRAVPEGPVSRGGGRGGRRSSECEKGASINCPLPSPLDPPQHTHAKKNALSIQNIELFFSERKCLCGLWLTVALSVIVS